MKRHSPAAKREHVKSKLPAYRNAQLPAATRTRDLLSRMTLEEKAAQMMCVWQEKAAKLVDAQGNFDFNKARAAFKDGRGIGQVGRPWNPWVRASVWIARISAKTSSRVEAISRWTKSGTCPSTKYGL